MSKTIKRKITVELSKPRELSKSRLSVFQRLGSKKQKSIGISEGKSITKTLKQTLSAAVNISTTSTSISTVNKTDNAELEDADPDILEKKRAEIQKELELQMKMESRKAVKEAALRKRKRARSSSTSSSGSSGSGTSSTSSTSSSSAHASVLKARKSGKSKRHDSSSSSDEARTKKAKKKLCHAKKEAKLKLSHSKKLHLASSSGKSKKRSVSPLSSKKQRLDSTQKVLLKENKLALEKHRIREKEKERERERELQQREREREKERERERLRLREKEHVRSRSPKLHLKSRSPKRLSPRSSRDLVKAKSPLSRRLSPTSKSRLSVSSSSRSITRRHDSRERERRDKERQDREAAREKERREALARCQERQRERERLAAKEKTRRLDEEDRKIDRLLPRPAERAMALAAARDRSRESTERERHLLTHPSRGIEKDHVGSYSRGYIERSDDLRVYDHRDRRVEKDSRDHVREFRRHDEETLRDVSRDRVVYDEQQYEHLRREERRAEYATRATYDDQRHRLEREREWTREELAARELARDTYDRGVERHPTTREWDRGHTTDHPHSSVRDTYNEGREWSSINDKTGKPWESRERESNWPQGDTYYADEKWDEQGHGRAHTDKLTDHTIGANAGNTAGRRWANWRARRGNHHGEYRRHEIFEERGEIYRRHINPQGNNTTTTSTTTPTNTTITITTPTANSNGNTEQQKIASPAATQPITPHQLKPDEPVIAKPEKIQEKTEDAKDDQLEDVGGEEIADDLSEISDEADDILNCQEEQIEKSKDQLPATVVDTETVEKADSIIEDVPKSIDSPAIDQKVEDTQTKDMADEIDLDFEEISDGELEEEARNRGLGDALGVDWASLIEESKEIAREKSKSVESSARQRWQPHRILLDTGISFKMAGESFAKRILQDAHAKLIAEIEEEQRIRSIATNGIVKIESMDTEDDSLSNDTNQAATIKREDDSKHHVDVKEDIKELFKLELHPLACVQVGTRLEANRRQQLVFNAVGPFSRALCAKRDIGMRRQLCGLPIKENNCKLAVAKQNSGYEAIAAKLFQKALEQTN